MAGFVHLHTHSEYSDFDGLSSVGRLVAAASADGQGALAITDHGRLASLAALRSACEVAGDVKPIPGMEAYIVPSGTRHDPGTIEVAADSDDLDAEGSASHGTAARTKTKKYEHLTILAATATGLANLIEMSNVAQGTKSGTHPLIDYELLAHYGQGLIVLTGCVGGPVAGPLSRITGEDPGVDAAEQARAQDNLDALIAAVGQDSVYVELADHGQATQERALAGLYAIAESNDLPVVVANDSHYVSSDDQAVHEAHMALGQKRTVSSQSRYRFAGSGQFFRTGEQMRAVRPEDEMWQRGCDETVRIAERIEADLFPEPRLRVPHFPISAEFTDRLEAGTVKAYPVPHTAAEGTDAATFSYFMHQVHAGATERWGENLPAEVTARIKFELSVICRLGVMDYFLLVADLIAWARSDWTATDWVACHDTGEVPDQRERKQSISVGPGRGSAPGSAISYALQIVGVDPIENGLLFERFLDLERTEMPDIDVDFERERRDEVIEYLSVRYGHDNVCRLGMHGTNQTKRALDSAGRYLEIPVTAVAEVKKTLPADCEDLALLLDPDGPDTSAMGAKDAAAARDKHAAGQALRDHLEAADEQVRTMAQFAAILEGVVVSPGKHACGIVVADENLMPLVPMRLDKGEWVTEWDGPAIADFGLLKMDVLGLRNLDIAHAAHHNAVAELSDDEGIDFDLTRPQLDGPRAEATWQLLGRGDSTGIFQLESEGMRELLTTAHPRSLDDLSALIAAYRPGPMSAGMHTEWAQRAGGHEPVAYDSLTTDPAEQDVIASVLDQSQGVILFQEQMMRLGKIVGKFDAARANNLRRAISKKKQDLIDSLKSDFIAGAQTEGVGEDGTTPIPAFSQATAERLWTAFAGSGRYSFNRCIRASTEVRTANRSWTVGELYAKLHGTDHYGEPVCACGKEKAPGRRICTTCESWVSKFHRRAPAGRKNPGGLRVLAYDFADGRIRPKRVGDVHFNGYREMLEIETNSGRTIGVTANHRLMAASRTWVEAGSLRVGDELVMHGGFEPQRFVDFRTTTGDPHGRRSLVSPRTGSVSNQMIDGGYARFMAWTDQTSISATCERPGPHQGRFERAHLDGDRTHNDRSNLEWMCVRHHKMHDYRHNDRKRQWDVGHAAVVESITAIRILPPEPVYDLEMDDAGHNFIADGFVSHNSHTAAYGVIAYQTAYLKANWPAEFGAAVLRFTGSGTDKSHLRVATIRSLRAEGIEVMAPDINASDEHTVAREGKVWIGLGEIKGVGSIASEIVAERTRSGPFSSMADVATRVVVAATTAGGKRKSVTSAQLSALAQAGAFDSFGGYRLGHVIASRAVSRDPEVRIPAMEYSVLEKAARQRGVILAVTGTHPTKALSRQVAALYRAGPDDDAAAKPPRGLHRLPGQDGARVHTGGVVSAFSERLTRKGSWMVTLELENAHTSIGCVGFADVHADLKEIGMPEVGDLVEIRGRVRLREVEREVIDEATGQASTQTSLEHSIYLSGLEYMEVDDPDRDAEGAPELAVGRMLSDGVADPGAAVPPQPRQSPPATDTEVGSVSGGLAEDEEVFEPITAQPGGAEAARRAASESAATSRSRGAPATVTGSLAGHSSLEAVDLSEIAASSQWTRLREVLSQATGEGFALAWPRQGTLRGRTGEGSFLRVETERGSVKVPVSVQRRLADLAADGRLPVFVATARLRCVVLDPRDWHSQLQAMADAIHSGAIDPAVTSIDAPAATAHRAR